MTDNLEIYNRTAAMFRDDVCIICGVQVSGTLENDESLQQIHLDYHRSYWRTLELIRSKF